MSFGNESTTRCPECRSEIVVDWKQSNLDDLPQVLAVVCSRKSCRYRYSRTAPTDDGGEGYFWCAAEVECRICSHRCAVVFPADADDAALECSNCGHMSAEAIYDDDEECHDDGDPLIPA